MFHHSHGFVIRTIVGITPSAAYASANARLTINPGFDKLAVPTKIQEGRVGRRRVITTYTRARVTPSKRITPIASDIPPLKQPKGLSPLAAYIEENLDTGITVPELIEQFQEYDCEHRQVTKLAVTAEKITTRCDDCGLVETNFKPGVENG
jgi:hypothetical protein